jgi:uncharacterized protein (TIGR02453 family)
VSKTIPFDDLAYPPFTGFPREGVAFLKRLKKNNNRPWFHRHKQEYDEHVRFPMQCLIASLAHEMADIAPEFEFNPKRAIFRIHRDTRFSRNKTPYKTNIAAAFNLRGAKGQIEMPGLYVGIEPGSIFIGGGLYMPTGDQLKAIRKAMVSDPDGYLAVVEERRFKREFGGVQGERLQKAPLGYPRDHPMIQHLRHRQFYVGKEYDDETICFKPRFLGTVVRVFADTMPLVRWLRKAVG